MPICKQCGVVHIILTLKKIDYTCPECLRKNEEIRREARLQEEGRLQALSGLNVN